MSFFPAPVPQRANSNELPQFPMTIHSILMTVHCCETCSLGSLGNSLHSHGIRQCKGKYHQNNIKHICTVSSPILQKDRPSVLPASVVASILSSRLAPHFDISPASSQAAATTKYKSAQDLLTVNPFKVLDGEPK